MPLLVFAILCDSECNLACARGQTHIDRTPTPPAAPPAEACISVVARAGHDSL